MENLIQNKILDFKIHFFQKPKFHYKPTCEMGSCEKSTFLSLCLAKGTVGV
jgi:hypothetical protein